MNPKKINFVFGITNILNLQLDRFSFFLDIDLKNVLEKNKKLAQIGSFINDNFKNKNYFLVKTDNGYHLISPEYFSWREYIELLNNTAEFADKKFIEYTKHKNFATLRISKKMPCSSFNLVCSNFNPKNLFSIKLTNLYEIMIGKPFYIMEISKCEKSIIEKLTEEDNKNNLFFVVYTIEM